MTIDIEQIWLKPGCYVKCVGWGGELNRERLNDTQAIILLDIENRLIEIAPAPGKRGEGMTIPLENALQWKPKSQQKRATSRTGTATSAKA